MGQFLRCNSRGLRRFAQRYAEEAYGKNSTALYAFSADSALKNFKDS
jgi:hypothetical protein